MPLRKNGLWTLEVYFWEVWIKNVEGFIIEIDVSVVAFLWVQQTNFKAFFLFLFRSAAQV